jgi:ATP synthase I chain
MAAELNFERAAWRIGRIIMAIAALGTCGLFIVRGWQWGTGFLLGSAISGLNFHWLYKLVQGLGSGKMPQNRAMVLGFRYLLLGGGAYVILRLSRISLMAVFAGVFVLTAAVFLEVIFEIVHARK